jgi:hypothetical protein
MTWRKFTAVAGSIGTHGMAHALETVLEASRLVQQHPEGANIRFVLLGDGARKQALRAKAAEMGLGNLSFLDEDVGGVRGCVYGQGEACRFGLFSSGSGGNMHALRS